MMSYSPHYGTSHLLTSPHSHHQVNAIVNNLPNALSSSVAVAHEWLAAAEAAASVPMKPVEARAGLALRTDEANQRLVRLGDRPDAQHIQLRGKLQ